MAEANKTEKATPQKRKKAREQGQVARSRELSSALAWGAAMAVIAWQTQDVPRQWRGLLQTMLDISTRESIMAGGPELFWTSVAILRWVVPVLAALWVMSLGAGVAQGGLVFAPEALAFRPEKLSPANKVKQMFSLTGLGGILKSLLPFGVIAWIGFLPSNKLAARYTGIRCWRPSLHGIPREHNVAVVLEIGLGSGLLVRRRLPVGLAKA